MFEIAHQLGQHQPADHPALFRPLRLLLLLAAALFIFGCQAPGPGPELEGPPLTGKTTIEDRLIAEQYEQQQEWEPAASMYQYLAQNSEQPERSRYLQKMALMLYQMQRYEDVQNLYQSLAEEELLEPELTHRDVLLSGIYFDNGKTYQSLGNLPDLETLVDDDYKVLALTIRSEGILAIGNPMESAQLRMQISQYLDSEAEIQQNQEFIWDALNRISESNVIDALYQKQEPQMRGWLELNLIARRSNMLPSKMEPWVKKWYELYPTHEAGLYYSEKLLSESRLIHIVPTRIALMLPFSDKFKNVAEAIQNGFLHAYYNDPAAKPELEIVNVSDNPEEFLIQYNQAIQNGADFIVGPLDKKLVNQLQMNESLQVPTLTLNYADDASIGINNLYQFGLRPEDEAEQIADFALIHGRYHAVTLTPDNKLGERLQKAFTERFEGLGGQVVASQNYPSRKNDYSASIKQLLNLNSSQSRLSILQKVIDQKAEFIPRRRRDVDMVFIAGNPRQARLIKPQLKFHHAKDLPVYATSSISSGVTDTDADRDLNEILYVDTPWALDHDNNADYQQIRQNWPNQSQRYAKFFALGLDAYRLIPALRKLLVNPEQELALNSGQVSLDRQGRIHRQLLLATFERGKSKLLGSEFEIVDNQ
ncbi:MAG: penicillin-binding protein activator [Gammaproteobacteria bacterium]|nr:penicillin-binding protein activator [Gammaproteobacteria bacterium]